MQMTDDELAGAVARGWCSPENSHKEMDADLVMAIVAELRAALAQPAEPALLCPTCSGNEMDAPCAYPEGGQRGCLRDLRMAQPAEPVALTDDYVQQVPDKCDRIVWRGRYYHLPIQPAPAAVPLKLWLWKNFVDGRPEYWAFDNPFPVHMDYGDPQTLGEPCGYAIFKSSRQGRADVSETEVLRRIAAPSAGGAA